MRSFVVEMESPALKRPKVAELVEDISEDFASTYLRLEQELTSKLSAIEFGPFVKHVYDPIVYAYETHAKFVRKFANNKKRLMFLGMNPGPFGMVQSGVPFGECRVVREWMGIEGQVGRPVNEHPKRPVHGLMCRRSEVSGARFWGLIRDICLVPETFFVNCFVHNYCPLAFLNENGKNLTPIDLKRKCPMAMSIMEELCDEYLIKTFQHFDVDVVVGLGNFVYEKCIKLKKKCPEQLEGLRIEKVAHPSPINPANNRNGGWNVTALAELEKLGLFSIMQGSLS